MIQYVLTELSEYAEMHAEEYTGHFCVVNQKTKNFVYTCTPYQAQWMAKKLEIYLNCITTEYAYHGYQQCSYFPS